MIHNKIIFRGFEFDDDSIFSGSISLSDALVSEELPIDSMIFETLNFDLAVGLQDVNGVQLLDKNGTRLLAGSSAVVDLSTWDYGEPVVYYHNGNLIGKFYVESAVKLARYRGAQRIEVYKFTCVSAVGLLENREHYGGMYEATPAGDILAEIIGDLNIEVESTVATTIITGHLPKASARKNLHWILNAIGASLIKNDEGDPFIAYVASPEPRELADEFFQGETVTYSSPSTAATVTEHAFIASEADELVELYDSTDAAIEPIDVLVLFDEPVHSLEADGLTVGTNNCNHAVISGYGKLYGKKYTHITTEITQSTGVGGKAKIVTSSENTLVSVLNSLNVSKRLAEYSATREMIKYETALTEPMRPSDDIRWTNQFDEQQSGYVRNLSLTMSKDLAATAEIVLGWTPKYLGNNAASVDVLTGSGTYTVPDGVTEIRVVLIGGGQGGQAGHKGGDAGYWFFDQPDMEVSGRWRLSSEAGGAPGEKGTGGNPGKILSAIISVTPGQQIAYSCGTGGEPGSVNAEIGEFGTGTTFGARSSDEGAVSLRGFQDPLTGIVYGAPGLDGINGAKGGDYRFEGFTIGLPGDDLGYDGVIYSGGAPGHFSADSSYRYWGAAGGGAAFGEDGGDVIDAHEINGGTGASSLSYIPTEQTNGSGGRGGNGGGGGGAPGTRASRNSSTLYKGGDPGTGGDGSPAQPGADGIIFVLH